MMSQISWKQVAASNLGSSLLTAVETFRVAVVLVVAEDSRGRRAEHRLTLEAPLGHQCNPEVVLVSTGAQLVHEHLTTGHC